MSHQAMTILKVEEETDARHIYPKEKKLLNIQNSQFNTWEDILKDPDDSTLKKHRFTSGMYIWT